MHSNVWYQAYVFKESANEVKVCMCSVSGAIIFPYPGHPEPCSQGGPVRICSGAGMDGYNFDPSPNPGEP